MYFPATAYGTFQPPRSTNTVLETLAVGDFNGDGIPDLAGTSYNKQNFTGTFSLLLGNGDGTFTDASDNSLPAVPASLMTGDFNGDGKLDVAVADQASGVYVFLGNGDGTFQNPVISNIDNLTLAGAVGDFNGDGKLDLSESKACNSGGLRAIEMDDPAPLDLLFRGR